MGLGAWFEARTGLGAAIGRALDREVPAAARWQHALGSLLIFLFVQQVVLGILLTFYYSPSASDAWASTAYLNDQVSAGWFLRGLHHHGVSVMVVVVALYLLRMVWTGAYRAPRELIWWTGLVIAGLVMAFALTGYPLPWDQKGFWGMQVRAGILGSVPGGELMQQMIQGGPEYGNLTLTHAFALHAFVLPLALGGALMAHFRLIRRHGATPAEPEAAAPARRSRGPNQLLLDLLAMAACSALLVGMTVQTHGAELFAPADPASSFIAARPEWYFLSLFQMIKYFQGPLQIVATVLLPGAVAVLLFALPWIDRASPRRAGPGWPALTIVGALMAGVTALTAVALVEDARNESYQHGLVVAEQEAARARALAREGVPPAGGIAVFDNDPKEKARKLFKEHCATCHTIEGRGGEEAPSFDDYGSREWLFALVRDPRAKRFYGGTKAHTTMEPVPASALDDEKLRAVVEYMVSLSGPEMGATDATLVAAGKALWDGPLDCSGCHEVEAGKEGAGPNLAGRGSVAWIARMIRNPAEPDLYGESAEMPKFADKLSAAEVEALAGFIAAQGEAK